MLKNHKYVRRGVITLGIIGLSYLVLFITFQPSHNRDWELGHEALPHITYATTSSSITIDNFRNFNWTAVKAAEVSYETRTFDLDQMSGVDVLISHFDAFEGLAHIFLSFGFKDGQRVVVSLETRRESDETFSPLLGMLRQFELIYVVGSEEDIVGVRTGHRDERVYLYPTKATAEQARKLFGLLVEDINGVYQKPRMYNTLTNNCTNELTRPVEVMSEVNFPLTWKTILPGYFDEVLYDLDLIDTSELFTEIKSKHLINNESVDVTSDTYSADLRKSIENL